MPRAASRGAIVVPLYIVRFHITRLFPGERIEVEVGARLAFQKLRNVLRIRRGPLLGQKRNALLFASAEYFKCPVLSLFKLNRTLSSISIIEFTLYDLGQSEKYRDI